MQTAIAKWGNSLALRLPRRIAEDAGMREGTPVDLRVDGQRLVVTPARPRYRLSELLSRMRVGQRHEEVDWGASRGEEEW